MKLDKIVAQSAVEAVKSLYGQDVPLNLIQVQKTRPEFEGNMTLVIFPLLKNSRKKPEDTAREIGSVNTLVRRADGTVETIRTGEVSVRGLYGYVE